MNSTLLLNQYTMNLDNRSIEEHTGLFGKIGGKRNSIHSRQVYVLSFTLTCITLNNHVGIVNKGTFADHNLI